MGFTILSSIGWPGWLFVAVVLSRVCKPLRDLVNEWRLYKRQQKYPHMVVFRSPTPKKSRKLRNLQQKGAATRDATALLKASATMCFAAITKLTMEVLVFLCRQVSGAVSFAVFSLASLLLSRRKVENDGIPVEESQSSEPDRATGSPARYLECTTPPSASKLKMNNGRNTKDRGSSYFLQQSTPVESPTVLRGEAIEEEEEVEAMHQQRQARRVRTLSPSRRLRRRIPIKSPAPRPTMAQIQVEPSQAHPMQYASPASIRLSVRAEPVDTSSLSEQMNKRRLNGEGMKLGITDGKRRRIAYGRTPLQGCAPHLISRARMSKRVRVEREERILESMSRKRVKPNPEPATTEAASIDPAPTSAAPGASSFGQKLPMDDSTAAPSGSVDLDETPRIDNKSPKPVSTPNFPLPFSSETANTNSAKDQQQLFSFGSDNSKSDAPAGQPSTTFSFGTAASSNEEQQQSHKPFAFGSPAAEASATNDHSKEQHNAPQAPTTTFGNPSGSGQTSSSAPANTTTNVTFGQAGSTPAPTFNGGLFNGGSSTQTPASTATPNFGAANTDPKANAPAPFSTPTPATTQNGSAPPTHFGTKAPTQAATLPGGSSGNQAPAQSGFGFGSAPQSGAPNSFTASQNAPAPVVEFGAQKPWQDSSTPAVQAGSNNPFGAPQNSSTPASQFGSQTSAQPCPTTPASHVGAMNPFSSAAPSQFGAQTPAPTTPAMPSQPLGGFGTGPASAQTSDANPFGAPSDPLKTPQASISASNGNTSEQKENANPFASSSVSSGFQQATTTPTFHSFGAANGGKPPASDGFKPTGFNPQSSGMNTFAADNGSTPSFGAGGPGISAGGANNSARSGGSTRPRRRGRVAGIRR